MMSPQLRLDTSYLRNYDGAVSRTLVSPEPRLSVALQVLPRLYLTLKAGIGAFSQLAQPQELNRSRLATRSCWRSVAPPTSAASRVEPTSTLFTSRPVFLQRPALDDRTSDPVLKYTNSGLGRVIGGDFLLRQKLWKGCSAGWPTPSRSRSGALTPQDPWRLFRYDQTHILTAVASATSCRGGASRSAFASAT
jgi:hypothetical protein